MVRRRKRSHIAKLYLLIKDYIYYHIYFQYQEIWHWIFIIFCINFVAWDIFDILRLQFIYEYKLYVWKRELINYSIFLSDDILINILNKHKMLYSFFTNFEYYYYHCNCNNTILFLLQIYKNNYLLKQTFLKDSINENSWILDIFYTISM